jgi:predicted GNAT family N-acyltransferase
MSVCVDVLEWSEARYVAQTIRRTVFIEEQGIPEKLEIDEINDQECVHAVAFVDKRPVGTGRLFRDGHVGRMAVLKEHRSKSIGAKILFALIDRAREMGVSEIRLAAQTSAEKFYIRQVVRFLLCEKLVFEKRDLRENVAKYFLKGKIVVFSFVLMSFLFYFS